MKSPKYKRLCLLISILMIFSFIPQTTIAADNLVADSGVYELIGSSTNNHTQAHYLWQHGNKIYVAIVSSLLDHQLYKLMIDGEEVEDVEWLPANLEVYNTSGTKILDETPEGKASSGYRWLVGIVDISTIPLSIVVSVDCPPGFALNDVRYTVQGALNVWHEYPPAQPVQDLVQSEAINHIGGLAPGEYNIDPVEKPGYEYSGVTITVGGTELISVSSGETDHKSFSEGTIEVLADGAVTVNLVTACDKIINVKYLYTLKDYTLTINYEYADESEAAASYVNEAMKLGDPYSVSSPVIAGYTADQLTVSGTMPAADVTVTVVYTANDYTLTLEVFPVGGGSVTGEGTFTYGEVALISANPNIGYAFVNWTNEDGVVVSNLAEFSYSMPNRDVTLTANFEEILIVDPSPPEGNGGELPKTGASNKYLLLQIIFAALLMGVGFFLLKRYKKVKSN